MKKRIVICADGTWNRPEEDHVSDVPTNVLRLARSIRPFAAEGTPQHVFYDWGIGSYGTRSARLSAGATGRGIHKNIMDGYRYIVQNYEPGSEIYLFGFSRGAYTVRSLCGLIYNCGILKRPDAHLIQAAFDHYKREHKAYEPRAERSVRFRKTHSHRSRRVSFVGVWDTVGALGIPFSLLGLFDRTDEFYDTEPGPNIQTARHALAIDEQRVDFQPTLWKPRQGLDLQQAWFSGVHADIGGGYARDKRGLLASDVPLAWMIREAAHCGLDIEPHLRRTLQPSAMAKLNRSRRHIYRIRQRHLRALYQPEIPSTIHRSVKERWDADPSYRPNNLREHINEHGWPTRLEP